MHARIKRTAAISNADFPGRGADQENELRVDAQGRIQSLDGLRCISVLLVLLAHFLIPRAPEVFDSPFGALLLNGQMGVNIFFVISGFLITHLLVEEYDRRGTLSLKDFYIRRSFRILPAFYLMIAATYVVWRLGYIQLDDPKAFLYAATFTWNYSLVFGPWYLAHSWSLAVEEQFYLLWPLVFLLVGPRRALWICLGAIAAAPLLRVGTWWLFPGARDQVAIMFHTRYDFLAFGCLTLLALRQNRAGLMLKYCSLLPMRIATWSFILVVSPYLSHYLRGAYQLPVGYTLEALAISMILLDLVTAPRSKWVAFFNSAPIRWVGVRSYSIYLWHLLIGLIMPLPLMILALGCAVEASYHLIEQPFLRLRSRLFPSRVARQEPVGQIQGNFSVPAGTDPVHSKAVPKPRTTLEGDLCL